MTKPSRPSQTVTQISEESPPPVNQPDFIKFYEDLTTAFKNHSVSGEKSIKMSPRTFSVCWTKLDPGSLIPIWGEIEIESDNLHLMTVEGIEDKQILVVVEVGIMDDFPGTKAVVYYCYANDMLYYYPFEGFSVDSKRPRFQVYPYRRFGELAEEFM